MSEFSLPSPPVLRKKKVKQTRLNQIDLVIGQTENRWKMPWTQKYIKPIKAVKISDLKSYFSACSKLIDSNLAISSWVRIFHTKLGTDWAVFKTGGPCASPFRIILKPLGNLEYKLKIAYLSFCSFFGHFEKLSWVS